MQAKHGRQDHDHRGDHPNGNKTLCVQLFHNYANKRGESSTLLKHLKGSAKHQKECNDHDHIGTVAAKEQRLKGRGQPAVNGQAGGVFPLLKLTVRVDDDLLVERFICGVLIKRLVGFCRIGGVNGVATCRNGKGQNPYKYQNRQKDGNNRNKAF